MSLHLTGHLDQNQVWGGFCCPAISFFLISNPMLEVTYFNAYVTPRRCLCWGNSWDINHKITTYIDHHDVTKNTTQAGSESDVMESVQYHSRTLFTMKFVLDTTWECISFSMFHSWINPRHDTFLQHLGKKIGESGSRSLLYLWITATIAQPHSQRHISTTPLT